MSSRPFKSRVWLAGGSDCVFLKTRRTVEILIGYTKKIPRRRNIRLSRFTKRRSSLSRAQQLLFVWRKVDEREPRTRMVYVVLSAFFAFHTPYPVGVTVEQSIRFDFSVIPIYNKVWYVVSIRKHRPIPFGNADDTCVGTCTRIRLLL